MLIKSRNTSSNKIQLSLAEMQDMLGSLLVGPNDELLVPMEEIAPTLRGMLTAFEKLKAITDFSVDTPSFFYGGRTSVHIWTPGEIQQDQQIFTQYHRIIIKWQS